MLRAIHVVHQVYCTSLKFLDLLVFWTKQKRMDMFGVAVATPGP